MSLAMVLSAALCRYCNYAIHADVKRYLPHLTVDMSLFGLVGQQYYSYWTGGARLIVYAS